MFNQGKEVSKKDFNGLAALLKKMFGKLIVKCEVNYFGGDDMVMIIRYFRDIENFNAIFNALQLMV